MIDKTFTLGSITSGYVTAAHNHTSRNERAVELALGHWFLVNKFLSGAPAIEIGAVMPYYYSYFLNRGWGFSVDSRIYPVIDPADEKATHKMTWADYKNRMKKAYNSWNSNTNILSISTIEHMGTGEYGLAQNPNAARAFLKVVESKSNKFLITAPVGQNPDFDSFFFNYKPSKGKIVYMRKVEDLNWVQEEKSVAKKCPYNGDVKWATAIHIFTNEEELLNG